MASGVNVKIGDRVAFEDGLDKTANQVHTPMHRDEVLTSPGLPKQLASNALIAMRKKVILVTLFILVFLFLRWCFENVLNLYCEIRRIVSPPPNVNLCDITSTLSHELIF
jgi:hypothetical protein